MNGYVPIILSLTPEGVRLLIRRYGVQTVLLALQVWSQYRDGRASQQQEQTFRSMDDAIPKLLNSIKSKEIRVVPGAFNSSVAFTAKFQTAALVSISLALLDISSAIKRVGSSLEAIRNELAISNVAKIQGWQKDGFGAHVHRFIQNEILQVTNQMRQSGDRQRHYFYVWNPDTDWYPVFEEKNGEAPLGPEFGGYHNDLTAICLRMRTDREALIQRTSYGRTAKFHLLIPTHSPIVIDHPIVFHDNLLPLTVTGQRHRDVDFVWFNLRRKPQELHLQCVGALESQENIVTQAGILGFMACWVGCAASGIAAGIFPPCAPVAGTVAMSCWAGGVASWGTAAGGCIYDAATYEEACVLGDAIIFAEDI
ncbi:hypothetical protein CNMCM8694_000242 [Aspergillus lentulus]|nr:hypothetical protein CNMCM8060_005499 [Aspergillus lentulus]KAF4185770.1 hypothetical protein CNMCM7927_006328 [Aspergillus lentulus]KAF4192562.1 hypothetical protein CNMCM8694_000242 [Aspergillus lentulus]GFF70149.1 hypothetical protein IFM62136_07764 [Aspergillus lentulus]